MTTVIGRLVLFPLIEWAAVRFLGDVFCYTKDGMFILDVMLSTAAFPGGKRQG